MKEIFDHQDIQHRLWINWYHSNGLVESYTDTNLIKKTRLSFEQFLVLSAMNKLGPEANATEMAKMFHKNTNTLSTLLDRMEQKGLVKKIRDTKDRRLVFAVMTPKGRESLTACTQESLAIYNKLASAFSKEEMKEFYALLEKLMKNADKLVNTAKS